MKKKITLISVILLILLAFTACSSSNAYHAQIYQDYQDYVKYRPHEYLLNYAFEDIKVEATLSFENYKDHFNADKFSTYIKRIAKIGTDETFTITGISGSIKYTSEADEKTGSFTYTYEMNNIIVKYTLADESSQESSVSFSGKIITEDELIDNVYNITATTTFSLNGENKGTLVEKYINSDGYLSLIFNGIDLTKIVNSNIK